MPPLSNEDIAHYSGFIFGTSGMFLLAGAMGLEQYWGKLALSVAVGIGCGWALGVVWGGPGGPKAPPEP